MLLKRNNHVFKGHKALLGGRYVTYGELELPNRFEEYPKSKNGFDWGVKGSASLQLAYAILRQISTPEIAKENAEKFVDDVIVGLHSRDWLLHSNDILEWISKNSTTHVEIEDTQKKYETLILKPKIKRKKTM